MASPAFLKQQKTSGCLAFSFSISSVDDLGNSVSNVWLFMDLERECNTKDLKGKKFHLCVGKIGATTFPRFFFRKELN